ncbi:hypothetical protein BGX31_011013 [Mortierella sp. GBA43]|nr:hypothetical protein BGX31_011013 [Mortierella sp. GBA43]
MSSNKYLQPKRKQREVLKDIANFSLQQDDASDIDPVVNNFRFATDRPAIFQLLEEMGPKMRYWYCQNNLEYEHQYIWSVMDQPAPLGKRLGHLEGWLVSFLYSHTLNIFHTLPETVLQMTEKKPRKKRGVSEDRDIRHDGILYHHVMRKELLAIEAKRHDTVNRPLLRDMEKLEYALVTMLRDLTGDPLDKKNRTFVQDMRSFGMLISEYTVTFLEARWIDGHIMMYQVYKGEFPTTATEVYKLAELILMSILFKRRIHNIITLLDSRRRSNMKHGPK